MTMPKQLKAGQGQNGLQLSQEVSARQPTRPALTLRDIAAMIYRRRTLALTLFGAIFLVIVVATMLQPAIYMTRAQLLFKKERVNAIISASEGTGAEDKPQLSEEALNSEVEIVKSSTLLRDVLRHKMTYRKIVGEDKASALDSTEALELAVAMLKADMDCQIVPKSNIVQVSYQSKDPYLAVEIINDLCQRYVIRHLEVHESANIYAFFQKQAEVLKDTMQARAAELQRFDAEHNLAAPEQQRQLLLQKLAEYEMQLSTLRASAQAAAQQVSFLEKQLAAEPTRLQTQNEEVASTVVESLAKELASLKAKYETMVFSERDRGEPKSQVARSLKARIAQIEETINAQEHTAQPQISTDINRSMMGLATELTRARFDLIGYRTKEKELRAAMGQLRQELSNLESASFTHEAMVHQLELIKNNYLLYAKKQEEARISEALDREKVANVSIIDPASVPLSSVSPNRKLNIAMGFFLALFVGLGTAFGLSFFDGVAHTGSDIQRELDVPVIVTIQEGQWPPNLLPENRFDKGNSSEDFLK